jgi:hypothetical protein
MTLRALFGCGLACSALTLTACTASTPAAPTAPTATTPAANPLKISAPAAVSPVGGARLTTRQPTLVLQRATGAYAEPQVSYEIQVTSPNGDVVYTRTVAGGGANGQGTVSHVVETPLATNAAYRWRARAVMGSDAGPWSDTASGATMFSTTVVLTAASSNDEWRNWFFALIADKGVGSTATQAALAFMEPDMVAVGIIVAKDSSGSIRGRIYLPTTSADRFSRSVDVVTGFGPGQTWTWNFRGTTVCEGRCP